MELCADSVSFVGGGGRKRRCMIVRLEFKNLLDDPNKHNITQLKIWSSSDLLHAVAGLCSVCLPDMEVPAIYNSLTTSGCSVFIAIATPQDIVECWSREKRKTRSKVNGGRVSLDGEGQSSTVDENEDSSLFADIISGEESSDQDDDCSNEVDQWSIGREAFLSAARQRQLLDQSDISSVGPEHCLLGCAAVLRLSSKAECSAVQVTLLAVRRSSRRLGLGRYLMQMCKDPEVVGHYDALLAFADPKAESFFCRHGFNDDPILTAQYRSIVDHWENSTLMVYVPPFSTSGLAVGSLKTLTSFQDMYKKWRDTAITGYSTQLGVMERLRHELLLLHTKVQSQDELITALSHQLTEAREQKATLEREFTAYRKHTQELLCTAAVDGAEKWISSASKEQQ